MCAAAHSVLCWKTTSVLKLNLDDYCSSDLGKHQFTNCCLLKFFKNSINTVRTKIKDTNKLQGSLRK